MSYYFLLNKEEIWNPAQRIGQLFIRFTNELGELIGVPTGLTDTLQDECLIDPGPFHRFTTVLIEMHKSTKHPVMHGLLRGVLLPCIAIARQINPPAFEELNVQASLIAEVDELQRSMW